MEIFKNEGTQENKVSDFFGLNKDKFHNVVIVDDDPEIEELLKRLFLSEKYRVTSFSNASSVLRYFERLKLNSHLDCDLVVCDLKLPDLSGLDLIKELKKNQINIPVILITAHASVESAIEALKIGAFDYITKPINLTELNILSSRAIKLRALERDFQVLEDQLNRTWSRGEMVGRSSKILQIFNIVERVSKSHSNVLIIGESGTGKEMVARAIHENSDRKGKPFTAINCSAIPDHLLESELFGHRKGAFTGANESRKGLFEETKGGTIFLDEIGDMPLALQTKLLRVIQERKVKPVGENNLRDIDVRIIAATHQNLKKAIQSGEFREDLFYRLCVIPIEIPPLRERKDDIPLLAGHFLKKYCRLNGGVKKTFSKDALSKLLSLRWNGNVRELENAIERSVVLSNNSVIEEVEIQIEGDAKDSTDIQQLFSCLMTLSDLEKKYIQYVLTQTGDKKEKAAEILGINRKTLYRKEREYGLAEYDSRYPELHQDDETV